MKGSDPITTDEQLDSRAIEDRIDYLESELDPDVLKDLQDVAAAAIAASAAAPDDDALDAAADAAQARLDDHVDEHEELQEELDTLLKFREEAQSCTSEWDDGAQFIRDDYFEEYAEELAVDCGMIPKNNNWPCTCIDWTAAAVQLQQDYSCCTLQGTTYWVRG